MIIFLEVTPRWPTSSDPIRVCSAADRRAQTWDSKRWAAALHDAGSLSVTLFNGEFGSDAESSTGPVVLAEKPLLALFPDAQTAKWEEATFEMWAGDFSTAPGGSYPYANNVVAISRGKVSRFEKDGGAIKLSLDSSGEAGATKVMSLEYAGTGGAEGGLDLKGTLKPWLFGHAQNVEPVLIDEDNSVYQFSGYGPIQSVDALYERGSSFGASFGNYGSYALLVAASIPAGRWGTCLAEGLVRLGAPQFGVITGDVKGDYDGSVQRRRPGAILQRIADERGIDADAIDTDSLDALDDFAASLPAGGNLSLYLTEQTTFLELARRLAAPFNAQAAFSLLGKLFACRVAVGTTSFTIHAEGKRLPLVGSFIEGDTPPPYKRIIMSGEPSWRVNDPSTEVAFYATIRPAGAYDDSETYREGDVVTVPDGSTWLYINPIATAGNDPPVWPETSSVYWENQTPPLNGGKTFIQVNAPTAEESTGGDKWVDADGRYWKRVEDNVLSIGGVPVEIAGEQVTITWTENELQPILDARAEAADAQQDADDAAVAAAAANAALADIANDNLLTPGEKPRVIQDRDVILAEQAGIDASATKYGISTEKTAYDSAVTALTSYLATLTTPALWSDTSGNTTIVGATFKTKFADVYTTKQALLDKVADITGDRADWADIIGGDKPEDNADVTSAITGPADVVIDYDFLGTTPVGSLPRGFGGYKLIRNGIDRTADASWSATTVRGTIDADAPAPGVLSVDAVGGDLTSGTILLEAELGGIVRPLLVTLTKQTASAPVGGGGSSGATQTTSSFAAFQGTSQVSAMAAPTYLEVTAGAGGKVDLSAPLSYTAAFTTNGNYDCKLQWQEWNGSSWVNLGSEVSQSVQATWVNSTGESTPGSITCNYQKTGLTPGASFRARLVGRTSNQTTRDRYLIGTASAVGS